MGLVGASNVYCVQTVIVFTAGQAKDRQRRCGSWHAVVMLNKPGPGCLRGEESRIMGHTNQFSGGTHSATSPAQYTLLIDARLRNLRQNQIIGFLHLTFVGYGSRVQLIHMCCFNILISTPGTELCHRGAF